MIIPRGLVHKLFATGLALVLERIIFRLDLS